MVFALFCHLSAPKPPSYAYHPSKIFSPVLETNGDGSGVHNTTKVGEGSHIIIVVFTCLDLDGGGSGVHNTAKARGGPEITIDIFTGLDSDLEKV